MRPSNTPPQRHLDDEWLFTDPMEIAAGGGAGSEAGQHAGPGAPAPRVAPRALAGAVLAASLLATAASIDAHRSRLAAERAACPHPEAAHTASTRSHKVGI